MSVILPMTPLGWSLWPMWVCRVLYAVPFSFSLGQTWPFPPDLVHGMCATFWAVVTMVLVVTGELVIAFVAVSIQVVMSTQDTDKKREALKQLARSAFEVVRDAVTSIRDAAKALLTGRH